MPTKLSSMRNPDSFVMNEDTVNEAVANFLQRKGFECEPPLTGRMHGIDVYAVKGEMKVFVESKGSQKNGADPDEVFNHGQIVNHLARQIHTLMKYATQFEGEQNIFVMANPDIERIRREYGRVGSMIEKLGFVCMWVQKDRTVRVEGPSQHKLSGLFFRNEGETEVVFDKGERIQFIDFLMKEYSLGEKSAEDYVGRLNGILAKGIYKGEREFTPELEATITQEYPNSKAHYDLALKRFIEFQEKRKVKTDLGGEQWI